MSDLDTEFEKIRERYGSMIRAGVRHALGAETDAEDVIIECELALFTALHGSERHPPRSLVYRIIKNKVADHDEIAQRLSISKNTIRSHLKRIYKALGCNNRLKVAIWANSLFKAEKHPAPVSHRQANPITSDKSIA